MGEVLFEHMGIQGGKISKKSGSYSTGADVLEELSMQGHVIADEILKWRQISKLKSTYTDALPEEINRATGRIHTTYGMTITSTGRLSSIKPNLQNIPVRSEEGKKIRTAFVAEKGNKLISADYSQIELRLLACVADIKELKQAFADGVDVHALTASQVFGVPLDKIDSKLRYNAKAINFGIIYGQSAFGLANGLGISRPEAKQYIDAYFKQYPGILEYMESTKEFARKHGYVETIYGRKCFLPGINAKGPQRAFAERAAINAPLQGAAADIIKLAMIKLDKALPSDSKMILQIHDELLVEAPEEKAEKISKLMVSIMESANHSDVHFVVEANIGDDWGEIH
jgi:DNA polymerase-1